MFIFLKAGSAREDCSRVLRSISERGLAGRIVETPEGIAVAVDSFFDVPEPSWFMSLPSVERVEANDRATRPTQRPSGSTRTEVPLGRRRFGSGDVVVIAGPCAVESEEGYLRLAARLKACGADALRGGAWKPRTSPYSFQGLGRRGVEILVRAREETGLPIVTEAIDEASLDIVAEQADMIQIGSRNMQNYSLIRAAGRTKKPIFLKRGMAATLQEFLASAEYILNEGNTQIVLCERGIRTFSSHSRFTLDLSAIPALREATHLPVAVDPSHATGARRRVPPMARAAVAAGADGVMIEVHDAPADALSDGPQAILPEEAAALISELRAVAGAVGRRMETAP